MTLRAGIFMLLLPVVVAGCSPREASPPGSVLGMRTSVDGLVGRTCYQLSRSEAPLSIEPLTRPGVRGSILLWGRDTERADSVELSIRYGEDGRLSWVRAIRGTVSRDRVAELERALGAGVSEEGPADWGLRVLVVGGNVEAVLPSIACPPQRDARVVNVFPPSGTGYEVREAMQARGRHVDVDVRLDEEGRILDVRLPQSTGSRILDQHVVDLARAYRYHPKLHDGIGVPSTLPLRLRVAWR